LSASWSSFLLLSALRRIADERYRVPEASAPTTLSFLLSCKGALYPGVSRRNPRLSPLLFRTRALSSPSIINWVYFYAAPRRASIGWEGHVDMRDGKSAKKDG
jgi:hypothetical protein